MKTLAHFSLILLTPLLLVTAGIGNAFGQETNPKQDTVLAVANQVVDVRSPAGKVNVRLMLDSGQLKWRLSFEGRVILDDSPIKILRGKDQREVSFVSNNDPKIENVDRVWRPTFGQQAEIHDHHREVTWDLVGAGNVADSIAVSLAVFDDGVALRYTPKNTDESFSDRTGLVFADDFTFWSTNGENPNIGPENFASWKQGLIKTPITIEAADDLYCAVLEAAIYDQYPFSVHRNRRDNDKGRVFETRTRPTKFEARSQTSWRVVTLGKSAGDLIVNQVIDSLNPPCEIEDTSWIKTGLALWDWRSWGATAPDGFTYGLDMASWRRFIDFAASKKSVKFLLLDANWYGPEFDPNQDPKTSRDHLVEQNEKGQVVRKPAPDDWKDPIDIPAIIEYANQRDVGIILYFNDHARKKFDFEETLALYEKWGAAGIKYGFMATKGDAKVRSTRYIVQQCAKHKLLCNFHDGPIPGSGDLRTYPNYSTREFCHAQADSKRSFTPETFCTSVFINMLSGPLDMNNGLFAIRDAEKVRPRIFQKVNTTVVAETARTFITFSGMAVIPDIPEAYEAKADLFAFLEKLPMTWDQTRVLHGKIGDHISIARRSGSTWYVGTACDENGVTLPIDLSFLDDGVNYQATIFQDATDTHFETNPETYTVSTREVQRGDTIDARLAPGGGHCILLEPK